MRKILILPFIGLFLLTVVQAGDKKCRALVLEGGGDKGAWQAGVLSAMANILSSEDFNYDIISGVSIGSFNGYMVSTFGTGEEKEMSDYLLETWTNNTNVIKYWDGHAVETLRGLYDRPSFFDNSPFKDLIDKIVDERPMKRNLSIGVTDASTSESKIFLANDLAKEDLKTIILASTSIPVLLPYVNFNGTILIDGGVLLNADVRGAIQKCKEMVEDESDIIIDTVLCKGDIIEYLDPTQKYTAYEMLIRTKELEEFKFKLADILHAYHDYPNIQWRYVMMPLEKLPSSISKIFNTPENLHKMMEMGKDHAAKIIADPTLTSLDRLEKKKNQKEDDQDHNNPSKGFLGVVNF